MAKELVHYLALPYERVWESRHDDGDYFLVSLKDIPQVCGSGADEYEAECRLMESLEDYLVWRIEEGLPIPDPFASAAHVASGG